MKRKNKNAFTLVELLAVIVILAIILVIAVPKIMNVIKDTTKASLESAAKMVAAQVENQYTVAQTLGKEFGDTGSCMEDWAGLNESDYASCTYEITSDGSAKVTIKGQGKFKGLYACNATRSSAVVTEGSCSGCKEEEALLNAINVIKPYEIENSDSCVDYVSGAVSKAGGTQEYINNVIIPMCNGETTEGGNADTLLHEIIKFYGFFTELDLIQNNVIKGSIEEEIVCVPNYSEDAVTYINNLYNDSNVRSKFGLTKDNTSDENIRYVGQYVQNYVEFGNAGELWRIIGTFEVEKASGGTEELVKIVRDEPFKGSDGSVLKMSWDSDASNINKGFGVNEWSQSDLKTMLNTYYIGESTLCIYCNGNGQTTCTNSCNDSITLINSTYRNMIENVVWNTGAIEKSDTITPLEAYNSERPTTIGNNGEGTGKTCSATISDGTENVWCNDIVERTIEWEGKVGLMYPSDFGYAGGSTCTSITSNDCSKSNWAITGAWCWTISPYTRSDDAANADMVWSVGIRASEANAGGVNGVRPALYLKSNVQINGGYGSKNNPYKLSA